MTNTGEMLRHREEGELTTRETATSTGKLTGTISQALRKADDVGIGRPLPAGMGDAELVAAIYPSSVREPDRDRSGPDWPGLVAEPDVTGRQPARVTGYPFWRDYCTEALDLRLKPCRQTRFYVSFGEYLPGVYAFSDFSGETLSVTTLVSVGKVEIFVCMPGCSRSIFAAVVGNKTLRSWTSVHIRAYAYFGSTSVKLVIDNVNSGVTGWRRGEPALNPTFAEFAHNYRQPMISARLVHAREKGLVENAVRAILASLFYLGHPPTHLKSPSSSKPSGWKAVLSTRRHTTASITRMSSATLLLGLICHTRRWYGSLSLQFSPLTLQERISAG